MKQRKPPAPFSAPATSAACGSIERRQTRSQLTRPRASVGFNDFWVVSYARRRPTSSRFPQGSDSNLQIRNPINKLSGFLVLLQREKLSDQDQPSHHYHRSGKHRSVHATPQSQTLRFKGVAVGGADELHCIQCILASGRASGMQALAQRPIDLPGASCL